MTVSVDAVPVLGYLLVSLRIVAWLFLVPPFSGRTVPAPAKVVLSVGLSFAVVPTAVEGGIPTGGLQLVVIALTQVLIGVALGFTTQLILSAIAAAGSLIDLFGGFALATAFDPMGLQMNSVFGRFHQMLTAMLLFASGGHLLIIGGLLRTFEFLPLGESPQYDGTPGMLIKAFSMFFMAAVQIALPMIVVLFIADLGLALLTKVAPQMNAFNVMFPAKIGLTLLLVGLSFPLLPEATERLVAMVNDAASTFSGGG